MRGTCQVRIVIPFRPIFIKVSDRNMQELRDVTSKNVESLFLVILSRILPTAGQADWSVVIRFIRWFSFLMEH